MKTLHPLHRALTRGLLTAGVRAALLAMAGACAQAQPAPQTQPAGPRLMVQSGQLVTGSKLGVDESLALSPNAQLLASTGPASIRVWHTASGRLLCELPLQRVQEQLREAKAALRGAGGERSGSSSGSDDDDLRAMGSAYAWSADARTLYGAWPALPLQRWDIAGCRALTALALPFGPVLAAGYGQSEGQMPLELRSLADDSLLMNSAAGLYRLRVQGDRLEVQALAQIDKLRAAALAETPPGQPRDGASSAQQRQADAKKALESGSFGALRELALAAAAEAGSLSGEAMGWQLLGASADGGVALLGQIVNGLLPPELQRLSRPRQPLLVVGREVLPLSRLQGARSDYTDASLGAVSPQGRWLALHSDAGDSVRVSLFDVQARRLVQDVLLAKPPRLASSSAQEAMLASVLSRTETNRPLTGLAFSDDETRLALFREVPTGATSAAAGAARAPTGPVLEVRRVDALATVQRQVPLRGSVLGAADFTAFFSLGSGNKLVSAAGGQAFAFQVSRQFGMSSTLATGVWQADTPALRSWTPGEGSVMQLMFHSDDQLLSTHIAPLAPQDAVQNFLSGMKPDGRTLDPNDERNLVGRVLSSANAFQSKLQVVSWSLDSGQVQRLHQARVIPASAWPVDAVGRRMLKQNMTPDPSGRPAHLLELEQQVFDGGGGATWRRPMTDDNGRHFSLQRAIYSTDGRWIAALVQPRREGGKDGVRIGFEPKLNVGNVGRGLADKLTPGLAEKLRNAITGLRDKPQAGQPAASPAAAPDPVPAASGPAADVWLPGGDKAALVLVDAETGRALASLALSGEDAHAEVLHFVAGRRLLVGRHMVDIEDRKPGLRLTMPYGRAYDGVLVGVSSQTGRPIVTGGSAGSLGALRLPEAYRRAHLASTNADDRWLALAVEDRLVVLDVQRGMQPTMTLPLDGARVEALRFAPGGRLLAAGLSSGLIKLIDAPRARELATLMAAADGQWTVVDPQGRLDSSDLGANAALHWVTPEKPLQPLPFDTLMRAFHTPDLLPRAVHGDAALDRLPSMAGRLRATPQVAIDAVEPVPGTPGRVRLRVSVTAPREADGSPGSAQDLRVLRNGRLVAYAPANDGALPLDPATGRYSTVFEDVRLPEGDEPVYFQAYAFNRDGLRGEAASRIWQPPQPVKLGSGRAYVLAVGVNRYDHAAFGTLSYAVNDARLLAQAVGDGLRRSGEWREVVAVTLESTPGGRNDATKARIEAALGVLAGKPGSAAGLAGVPGAERLATATPADLVLISFAGHGYISPGTRELQLVPSDVAAAAGAADLSRFDAATISTLELDRWLRPLDAGRLSIVIDACHSAAAIAEGFRGGPTGSRGLGQLASDKGARLLAATQAANQALEHQRLQHGLLTYALVKEGLVGAQADGKPADGRIDLLEWLRYAEQRLPQLHLELARGVPLAPVQGERAVGRGIVRVDPSGPSGSSAPAAAAAAQAGLQRPRLFDFVPPGHAEPLVGGSAVVGKR